MNLANKTDKELKIMLDRLYNQYSIERRVEKKHRIYREIIKRERRVI